MAGPTRGPVSGSQASMLRRAATVVDHSILAVKAGYSGKPLVVERGAPPVTNSAYLSSLHKLGGSRPAAFLMGTPNATRNQQGSVVGGPWTYIGSGLHKYQAPAGLLRTGILVAALTGGFWMGRKTEVVASPVHAVSLLDSATNGAAGLIAGNEDLSATYLDGFGLSLAKCNDQDPSQVPGENCYAPGGSYYTTTAENPEQAELWGDVFDNLDAKQKALFLGLLAAGFGLAFLRNNRKRIIKIESLSGQYNKLIKAAKKEGLSEARQAELTEIRDELTASLETLNDEFKPTGSFVNKLNRNGPLMQTMSAMVDKSLASEAALEEVLPDLKAEAAAKKAAFKVAKREHGKKHKTTLAAKEEMVAAKAAYQSKADLLKNLSTLRKDLKSQMRSQRISPAVTSAVFAATVFGIDQGVSRELAHGLAWAFFGYAAVKTMVSEWGTPMEMVPGYPDKLAPKYGLIGAAAYLSVWTGLQVMSDSAGMYQFTPNGDPDILNNWANWSLQFNADLIYSYLANIVFIAPMFVRGSSSMIAGTNVLYERVSRWAHANPSNSWWARSWRSDFVEVPQDPSKLDSDGQPLPAYMFVRQHAQKFTAQQKAEVAAGIVTQGNTMRFATMLGISYGGYRFMHAGWESAVHLANGTTTSPATDSFFAMVGFGLGLATLDALGRTALGKKGGGRLLINRLQSLIANLVDPRGAASFWVIFSVLVGTNSVAANLGMAQLQGLGDKDGYVQQLAVRAIANPWVNRGVYGLWSAYLNAPMYRFAFYAPGHLTVMGLMEASARTGQTADKMYEYEALRYSSATTPEEKKAQLDKLYKIHLLISEAHKNNGYGREQTARRAEIAISAIEQLIVQFNIPSTYGENGSVDDITSEPSENWGTSLDQGQGQGQQGEEQQGEQE
jgi:hypothetical protein